MKSLFKKYFLDFLILGGMLLFITNYYFKLTEYSLKFYEESVNNDIDPFGILNFTEPTTRTIKVIHYDYFGFISTMMIVIGLYIVVRKYFVTISDR